MPPHDIIAIGASAGGLAPLLELVAALPRQLPACLFLVVHEVPDRESVLPWLLSRRGPLPALHPAHRDAIVPARIYVAPPDEHLLVQPGYVEVVRGPKENGHRPAVDPLFRSASLAYGERVVGVVLSGHQSCGAAGMRSIKARGGIGVVQDPRTAEVPEMPASAIRAAEIDHVVDPGSLPGLLVRLATEG